MAASTGDGDNYTVYYNPFSICSIMVRMTLALRGKPASEHAPTFTEQLIDIYKDEQLSESFLTTVNPKGQVPAMTSPALPEPLTDSLDITYHLCDLYPRLGPKEHKETIYRLLKELHQIQYLSLSFTPAQNRAGGITVAVEQLRAQPDISDKYREALEFKAEYHEVTLVHALEPEPIRLAERQAHSFFSQVEELRSKHDGLWIFGDEVGPTALDAHAVTFVARLYDANRKDLIPESMQKYGDEVMQGEAWDSVMQKRPTLYGLWMKMQGKSH